MTTPEELRALVVPCFDAATKRDLTETEMRIVWLVLRSSFGNGRQETGRLTLADVAACLGIQKGKASLALKKLRGMRLLQGSSEGDGWRFMPDTFCEIAPGRWAGHRWEVSDRLADVSRRMLANRVEAAQNRVAGEMALPGMEEPDMAKMLGEVAVEEAGRMGARGQRTEDRGQRTEDSPVYGEGGDGTGGGAGSFLPERVPFSDTAAGAVPIQKFSSLSGEPINTIQTFNREGVSEKGTVGSKTAGEALAEWDGSMPEDPNSIDEVVLMKRLRGLLGKETMRSREGARLRLFIRGSLEVEDSTDTAVAMRKAINDTVAAQREGKIKKSLLGYLRSHAFFWAGQMGWKFDSATMKWIKGKKFNSFQNRQAMKASFGV